MKENERIMLKNISLNEKNKTSVNSLKLKHNLFITLDLRLIIDYRLFRGRLKQTFFLYRLIHVDS